MSFAEVLKKELKQRGWSVYRLAEICQVPPSTIKGWLYSGREPSMSNALKLAMALGKTVKELATAAGHITNEDKTAYNSEETPGQVLDEIKSKVYRLGEILEEKQEEEKEEEK